MGDTKQRVPYNCMGLSLKLIPDLPGSSFWTTRKQIKESEVGTANPSALRWPQGGGRGGPRCLNSGALGAPVLFRRVSDIRAIIIAMRILVAGAGGREHALAWKLSQEAEVLCAPGNPGIAEDVECLPVDAFDYEGLIGICRSREVDFVVVGPEDPLVAGVADHIRAAGFPVYGPNADGARLEGSKAFSKELMAAAGVPTADFQAFSDPVSASEYARAKFDQGRALAVKANGTAVGKGVTVADTLEAALDAIKKMMVDREFGSAGDTVVLEDKLPGPEFSVLTLVGDHNFVSLPIAQDHKRAFDGDVGPNTGGMGTYSPVSWVTQQMVSEVERTVVRPAIQEMAKRGISFRGTLFSGLMMDGEIPRCLEYNVRFGDPEIQSLVLRLGSGLAQALYQAALGGEIVAPGVLDNASITVVVASGGYPIAPLKGVPVTFGQLPVGAKLFHAGTSLKDGVLVASGGRVIAASASAPTLQEAHRIAYTAAQAIHIERSFYRTDIAASALTSVPPSFGMSVPKSLPIPASGASREEG
jgi:phosphoribosylamine--glycine ligase